LQTTPEIKLLELTRNKNRITLDELAKHLHTHADMLTEKIERLAEGKLVNSHEGLVEMDALQRMRLAEQLVHEGHDPQKISRTLDWREFEEFAAESLERNGFQTAMHVVFKSRIGRREIDLLAWNDSILLAIDCKHWMRGLSHSRARMVAQAQIERAEALAERCDLLKKRGVSNPENRALMPTILCLSEPREGIVDGVPIVAVSKLISFLYGVSPVDENLKSVPVSPQTEQSTLM
jgi:Holliday junction resolvase-like predicted endonuclease